MTHPEFKDLKVFFDRKPEDIYGWLTVQAVIKGKVVKLFDRLPVRSGQKGHTPTSWTVGKSPIPYSPKGSPFRLWVDYSLKPRIMPVGEETIGEFFNISSGDDRGVIVNPANSSQRRTAVGLHPENKWDGTAGCIAVEWDDRGHYAEWIKLSAFLRDLGRSGVKWIPLEVV